MAMGQVLRDVNGRVLRDSNGKVKLWAFVAPPNLNPIYNHGLSYYTTRVGFNEANWNSIIVDMLNNHTLNNTSTSTSGFAAAQFRMAPATSGFLFYSGCTFDMDGLEAGGFIVRYRNYPIISDFLAAWYEIDLVETDLEETAIVRFVYFLSDDAPSTYNVGTDDIKAMVVFAEMTVAEIRNADASYFYHDLPDRGGYRYIYLGLELDWVVDGSVPYSYNADASDSYPMLKCRLRNMVLIQTS